ncbi:hypothetical protein [Sporomusa malonica]|uniref:hypothetical protein n=1 Tax=Sporomusa malonica TaxID=112901 RepID=UPI00111C10F4|nr:hypothetical protein [Sporomusa malonica]
MSSTVKELEGLGKAFQGNSTQTKVGEKSEPAAATVSKTNNMAAPIASFDSQARISTQTAVPAKLPAIDSKPASVSYAPFVGIVGITAVILMGLRLFKNRTKQNRTVIDYSKRTTTVINKDGLDIVIAPQTTAPKVKQNFELRV